MGIFLPDPNFFNVFLLTIAYAGLLSGKLCDVVVQA